MSKSEGGTLKNMGYAWMNILFVASIWWHWLIKEGFKIFVENYVLESQKMREREREKEGGGIEIEKFEMMFVLK